MAQRASMSRALHVESRIKNFIRHETYIMCESPAHATISITTEGGIFEARLDFQLFSKMFGSILSYI